MSLQPIRTPQSVTAPARRLKNMKVVYPGGWWSLAVGEWDGAKALLIRWNGLAATPLGNPVSRSHPTWFVLPDDFRERALSFADADYAAAADRWLNGEDVAWPDRTLTTVSPE